MYKPFKNVEEFKGYFKYGSAAIPCNKKAIYLPSLSLEEFLTIDYRVSNPRILSCDDQTKVHGSPFSQNKYANYVLGSVFVDGVLSTKPHFNIPEVLKVIQDNIREKVALSLSHSNKPNISGDMSVFLGKEIKYENGLFFSFLISTSIFYNPHRVTIGAFNDDDVAEEIISSLELNFNRHLGGDVEASIEIISPEKTMDVEDLNQEIQEMFDAIKCKGNSDDNFSDDDGYYTSSSC